MAKKLTTISHALAEGFVIANRALLANKTRAALTTLGIIIGVVTVTLMLTIIQGLNASFAKQISFLGSNTVYVDQYPWIWDDEWWKYINRPKVTIENYQDILNRSDLSAAVAPLTGTSRPIAYRDKTLTGVQIMGATPSFIDVSSTVPEFGRFINDSDNRSSRRICVIGQDVQNELFGPLDPIGRDIRVGHYQFRVVGILEKQGSTFGMSRDNTIIIPTFTLLNTFGRNRSLQIAVKAKDGVEIDALVDELTGIMRTSKNLKPQDDDNFSINRQAALQNLYKTMTGGVYAAGLIIGGISLLVGGIGIMNIMLVSVTERTWEIGMRKAIGAKTSHILWQFLVEAMMICVLGGVVGLGLAYLGSLAINNVLPTSLPLWLAGMAVLFSAGVGIVFGIFPAAKAARLDPISALRAQ
ncbi:ABC transporter permease [bacterium]|nr:ABC transporter permease [bacterium]